MSTAVTTFHPFQYGQRVKWLETTADATAQEYYHEGKVQGTIASKPEYLFVVDAGGKGHEVLKARLLDNEPADNNDEKQDDENPKVNPTAQKYDTGEVVEVGDLIASEGGVPGRVVDLIGECKETIGTMFTGNSCIYWRSPKGLQFVQRGTLTPVPEIHCTCDPTLGGSIDPDNCPAGERCEYAQFATPPAQIAAPEAPLQFSGLDPIREDTNPKDALAGFKPRWFSFIPLQVLIGVGKAVFEGGWKYGKHNFRESGVRATVYVDATVCGHLMPWMEGQDFDENGMHHIDKAIASLMVLRDAQINGNWIDDRPMAAVGFDAHMEHETAHFQTMKAALQAKHGDPAAPFTQVTHGKKKD